MSDRMDQLTATAVRQGFMVWQNEKGVWFFRKGMVTVTAKRTPETVREWLQVISTLRGAGLDFPEGE